MSQSHLQWLLYFTGILTEREEEEYPNGEPGFLDSALHFFGVKNYPRKIKVIKVEYNSDAIAIYIIISLAIIPLILFWASNRGLFKTSNLKIFRQIFASKYNKKSAPTKPPVKSPIQSPPVNSPVIHPSTRPRLDDVNWPALIPTVVRTQGLTRNAVSVGQPTRHVIASESSTADIEPEESDGEGSPVPQADNEFEENCDEEDEEDNDDEDPDADGDDSVDPDQIDDDDEDEDESICQKCGYQFYHIGQRKNHVCKFYGYFKCVECGHWWESAHAWAGYLKHYHQECKKCGSPTEPYKIDRLRRDGNTNDVNDRRPHEESLCEMCQILGRSCWQTSSRYLNDEY